MMLSEAELEAMRDLLSDNPKGGRDGFRCLVAARRLLAEVDELTSARHLDPLEEHELAVVRRHVAANSAHEEEEEWVLPSGTGARWSDMIHYLLGRLAWRDGVLTDMLIDSVARQEGAAEERRRIHDAVCEAIRRGGNYPKYLDYFEDVLEQMDPLTPPLPPEASRRRADELERSLREVLKTDGKGKHMVDAWAHALKLINEGSVEEPT